MITGTEMITGRERKILAYLQDKETVTLDDMISPFVFLPATATPRGDAVPETVST